MTITEFLALFFTGHAPLGVYVLLVIMFVAVGVADLFEADTSD